MEEGFDGNKRKLETERRKKRKKKRELLTTLEVGKTRLGTNRFLGKLCPRKHDFLNGQSLRSVNTDACSQCIKEDYLKRRGAKKGDGYKLTQEQKTEIIRQYKDGKSSNTIAKQFGVLPGSIRSLLKRRGIARRSKSEAHRQYTLNEAAFDEINSKSAYWVGFLFADGCVYRGNRTTGVLAIGLSAVDESHLQKFKTFLGSNHRLYYTERIKYILQAKKPSHCSGVSLTIGSERLAATLEKHGMDKKSLGRVAPDYLKDSADFWRGVIDGDGTLYIEPRGLPRLSLVGGYELLCQFLEFSKSINSKIKAEIRKVGNIFEIALGGEPALNIVTRLYTEPDVCLDRKYIIAKQILGWISKKTGETHPKAKLTDQLVREILNLGADGYSQQKIASKFGVNKSTIYFILANKTWKHIPRDSYD